MAAPTTLCATFQISTQNTNLQEGAALAVLRGGCIAVVRKDVGTNTGDIKLQIVQSDGTLLGGESTVNVTTSGQQTKPAITSLSGGGFVVSWTSFATDTFGDVAYRSFRAGGTSTQATDGAATATAGYQAQAAVCALDPGGFVVVWTDLNGTGGDLFQLSTTPVLNHPGQG